MACLVLSGTSALAQGKEAEKLAEAGDTAKQDIQAAAVGLKEVLVQYNAIIDGSVERKSAFKTLEGEVKTADRMIEEAGDSVAAMNKQAEKFFAGWQREVDRMSDEDLRERNQGRLDARRERYAALGEALNQAGEELTPFVTLLKDQINFLGNDLSDDAILDLQDEAKELNEMVAPIAANISELLGMAKPVEAKAEVDVETEAAAEEPAEADSEPEELAAEEEPVGEDDGATETEGDDD
jgi:hypothetical protein